MQRSQKQLSLIYFACGFISWLIFREMIQTIWVLSGKASPDWIVSPSDIVAVVLGFILFVLLMRSSRVNEFTHEVITELGKVIWPGKKETVLSTGVVSILVGICAIIFFLIDNAWGTVVEYFYR